MIIRTLSTSVSNKKKSIVIIVRCASFCKNSNRLIRNKMLLLLKLHFSETFMRSLIYELDEIDSISSVSLKGQDRQSDQAIK